MIYIKFTDRLGNNLFQFAAAKSIDPDVTIVVDTVAELNYVEQYFNQFYQGANIVIGAPKGLFEFCEAGYQYSPIAFTEHPVILKGYFQSHKYIKRDIILNQYKITTEVEGSIRSICDLRFRDYVSVHVRRGDYKNVQYKHPICNVDYFERAVEYFGKDKKYLVISDDLNWCKENLRIDNILFFDGGSPVNDLYVQSLCGDNIISNSSFSWWGAYLNTNPQKRVVAPTPWFGSCTNLNTKDLLLNDYQVISYKRQFSVRLLEKLQYYRDKFRYYTQ